MKRVIFLNWRWKCSKEDLENFNSAQVNTEDNKIVISAFEKDELTKHLENNIPNKYEESQYLIFSHNTKNSSCSVSKEDIPNGLVNVEFIKVFEFSSGTDYVYYGDKNKVGLFSPKKDSVIDIHLENFDKVWNHYWYGVEIEDQKKNLINTFLPLAIDMEGLINASNDEVRDKYYNEILNNINVNGDSIIKSWKDIKKILALKLNTNDTPKEFLSEDFRFSKDEKDNIYFCKLETADNPGFTKEKIIDLFKDSKSKKVNSINEWINNVIGIMDDKLNNNINKNPSGN